MNERVAQATDQVKQAFGKVTDVWQKQEPVRKKRILMIGAGLIAVALAVVIVLNIFSARYVVLYEEITYDESVQGLGILEANAIAARINDAGLLEVPSNQINRAMGILAIQGIPSQTLGYDIIEGAAGLTTTEFERRDAWVRQQQDRLQDTIKTYEGVQNAIVQLNIGTTSDNVWDTATTQASGSVTVHMQEGYILGNGQVSGIRHLVGSAVGIDPMQVTVLDGEGNLLVGEGEEYDATESVTESFLERMSLESEIEQNLIDKASTVMESVFPDTSLWSVTCTADLNFDAMVTEMKEYSPLEGTVHGVVDEEEIDAVLGLGQYAEGVVGETDNTDVPIYVDNDNDGEVDDVDYYRYRDYAVSYVLSQIEKDGPTLEGATLSVTVNAAPDAELMQQLRTSVAFATNLPLESVTVQAYLVAQPEEPVVEPWWSFIVGEDASPWTLFIIIGVVVVLIMVLVLVILIRNRAKRKRKAAEMALVAAEEEEAQRIKAEIEERKRQLKNAAIGDESENAITNEVREFARSNPEIAANLLRNWLKDGE